MLKTHRLIAGAVAALALCAAPAKAAMITFVTNGSGSDGPLAAQADFTTSAGQLQVTLSNLLAANVIRSAGQALSDITFTLSAAPGTLGTTSASGQLGNIDSNGVVTDVGGSPTRFLGAGGQGGFAINGNTITLETIGGGKPNEMIVPSLPNGGTFTNMNRGFQNFNPFVIGPATFTLDLSGVTAGTTVTAATFSFGTGPDTFLTGTVSPAAVPEPSTIIGASLSVLIGLVALRKKAKAV